MKRPIPIHSERNGSAGVLGLLGVLLALLLVGGGSAFAQGSDYRLSHKGWNGLSTLAALSEEAGCPLEEQQALLWDALSGQDVLVFVYPNTPIHKEALLSFLSVGGRVILADDFGEAGSAMRALSIERIEAPLPQSVRSLRDNPALPLALPQRNTTLGQATKEIATNHPAYFRGPLPATYGFGAGLGLVIEASVGRGRFVALSDPSALINNMLEVPGNKAFSAQLVSEFCRRGKDRLLLFSGTFAQRGLPPAVLLGGPVDADGTHLDLPDRWNQFLSRVNGTVQEGLSRKERGGGLSQAAWMGLVFAIAALLLCLRYLPLSPPPHDGEFAQPGLTPHATRDQQGLYSRVLRYSKRDVAFGYLYPAALLREEVLTRLSPYLVGLPRYGAAEAERITPERIEEAVAAHKGIEAGRLAGQLWKEFRTIPGSSVAGEIERMAGSFVPERRMHRLHELAVALFAYLDERTQ